MYREVAESQTLLINTQSKAMLAADRQVIRFGFGQSPFLPPSGGLFANSISTISQDIDVMVANSARFGDFTSGNWTLYILNTYFGETTEATNADIFDADLNLVSDDINPYSNILL